MAVDMAVTDGAASIQGFPGPELTISPIPKRILPCTALTDQNNTKVLPFAWAPPASRQSWLAALTRF
jgi:hypothetical protein